VFEGMPGRYVVYGAGAIGGTIGARLHQAGHEVVLIARGRHLKALRGDGLRLQTPDADRQLAIPAVGSPRETEIGHEDVVLLTMKSQDTAAALEELRAVADPDAAVVCAQNGVENERLALRWFAHVYGVFVWISAQHLEPGVVQAFAAGARGVLDLGRAPHGIDRRAHKVASDLQGAGFASRTEVEIMSWKYAKLLSNLGNAVEALLGPDAPGGELVRRARGEALACYAAAGIQCVTEAEVWERVGTNEELRRVNGKERQGGSSWQSLGRGSGGIETDYLNGEIVLLGRIHGVPTPVNHALTQIAGRMASDGAEPGSADPHEIQATIEQLGG
jgi:2-dehydropantoate 2-reductase